MNKVIIRIITFIAFILIPVCVSAQKKQLAQARDYIKSGKNLDKAESILRGVIADSAQSGNMKAWQLLIESLTAQYEKGNEQLYLKQKYDTLAFFTMARKLFSASEEMDSIDALPDEEGHVHPKFRVRNAQYLKTILPNLYYGGVYFVNKKDYNKAYEYFDHYIKVPTLPLFKGLKLDSTSSTIVSAAYWTMYCGYKLDSPDLIMRHHKLAERDSSQLSFIYQYEAEAYSMSHNDKEYLNILREGFRRYPKFPFFFPRLMEYYTDNDMPDSALALADRAIAIDSTSQFYRYAKSTVLLNTGRYQECIDICKKLIDEDKDLADAYYNVGLAYFNMAIELDKERQASRSKRQRILNLYNTALPYLEKYRKLAPDREDNWISPLYTIYLNLNMGKKFDEIDKLRHEYKRNHK